MILCSNPSMQYFAQKKEIDEAITKVLINGRYILGPEVEAFEDEFARYIGVSSGVGVGSGTEALHLALVSCGIGKGDEVITVSNTAVATVSAIVLAGCKPIFVDIDPKYYVMDTSKIEEVITHKTRAIVPVHLYGQPVDLDVLMDIAKRYNLRVIEDCAQAHGATYHGIPVGSFGDMACFSFYPTKNLGALGDGGMVVTSNTELSEKARLLREYGWKERNVSDIQGWNTRLDELQAAILRIKLRTLDNKNDKRKQLAQLYAEYLKGIDLVLPQSMDGTEHVYHLYVVRSNKRDDLMHFMHEKDIGALIHYPIPIHRQPAYYNHTYVQNDIRETERAAGEILSLPMYPELTLTEVNIITDTIRAFYGE
jgi:dTDP-3-amino-3,4,6-trideoxy-alpha-D-glucose transaminase